MRQRLKHAIAKAVSALGYTVIPQWRAHRYAQAAFLQKMFRLLDIECVLDVGANVGQYRDFLRTEVGFEGQIVSFEPIPRHVELLRQRAKTDARWLIEGCALGRTSGQAFFNVMASTALSSFLQPDHAQVMQFKDEIEIQERVPVEVRTLDEVLASLERRLGARRLFLKLDTQGFDLEVVQGARQSMTRIRALQTEASIKPIYSGMPDYVASIQTLQSLGFEVSGFFPVDAYQFPVLIEVDCVMVSRKYLPGPFG
jgi:FkbM family methyltransferase